MLLANHERDFLQDLCHNLSGHALTVLQRETGQTVAEAWCVEDLTDHIVSHVALDVSEYRQPLGKGTKAYRLESSIGYADHLSSLS